MFALWKQENTGTVYSNTEKLYCSSYSNGKHIQYVFSNVLLDKNWHELHDVQKEVKCTYCMVDATMVKNFYNRLLCKGPNAHQGRHSASYSYDTKLNHAHTFTYQCHSHPERQLLVQGRFDWTGGARNWNSDPLITRWPALPPERCAAGGKKANNTETDHEFLIKFILFFIYNARS